MQRIQFFLPSYTDTKANFAFDATYQGRMQVGDYEIVVSKKKEVDSVQFVTIYRNGTPVLDCTISNQRLTPS
jgi:hypothetical protein